MSLCSGGEQPRLKFALSLLPNPQILVLDEPTAGMDVTARRAFWSTMQAEAREGRTIIFATHYLEEAQAFAERVILVARGRIIADGPMSEIRQHTDIRVLTARIADEAAVREALERFSADLSYTIEAGVLLVRDRDTDGLARVLLGIDGVSDLEISAPSLEDAFVDMTEEKTP